MSYRGRYSLGDFIPLQVLCKDVNGVPTNPDLMPEARVFSPVGNAAGHFSIPVLDPGGQAGLFQLVEGAAAWFNITGNWRVVYHWTTGSGAFAGVEEDTFEVVNGGAARGNVISMAFYVRPNADFIVWQTDGGSIIGETQIGQVVGARNPMI